MIDIPTEIFGSVVLCLTYGCACGGIDLMLMQDVNFFKGMSANYQRDYIL